MRIFLLGTPRDVRGFALAGLDGRIAPDAESARRELDRIRGQEEEVGLLILSEPVARWLRPELASLTASGLPPAVILLPETPP